ncbi:3-hydroxyacyl-CoA dehydrogenase NAD-binding domain-containing protein [Pleionea sp. CnH1-48]|uniref:3-hydroxyacyl-CoA dehydrogenase NAD-binding domain-containing protein n=1 Tax=Pleionea sp. CnH1-48 TaxID=2954494 RepID=UPI0020978CA4|nr:3-hydroxyacyl-CoA dehydrogenase NAD-binding domain-containing protein [Pleionea sp. CnH1-48]MCO7223905.1 3-hydroxyacyl-CoA dehydrogenase NAD-binding domain-containing protein [Pleionea sp. CnH1-48]
MTAIVIERDEHNILHLILDKPDSTTNLMDTAFADDFAATVKQLQEEDYNGIIIRSAKPTFFAGGDLKQLSQTQPEDADALFNMLSSIKASMRWLETQGKPVVACINGAALGGGWEMALCCHYRIAVNQPTTQLGLPEVTLGLLPGAGGTVRSVRLLGLEVALPLLTEGKLFKVEKALQLGLLHATVEEQADLVPAAVQWIQQQKEARQPWDQKGYRLPGGTPSQPKLAQKLPIVPAILKEKTRGALPAPEAILSTMVEGAQVDFDTACRIESRYFVQLACGQIAKNLINTFWFQLNEIKAGVGRPQNVPTQKIVKVGILGAGMMGAGIAYSAASAGVSVVLKDRSQELAEKGKDYSRKLLAKRLAKGRSTDVKNETILNRIQTTDNTQDLADCDLVIEAVFEDRELKAKVTRETEAVLTADAIIASNTSTLPITGLATASERQENFIGLHFFSPVDKMPLVEIICGERTSEATLAKAYDFVLQIRKTPIIVKDARGFYTSRVFGTFTNEGMAMLEEGIHPASIENAAWLAGFPVGPLAVSDEVSLTLLEKVRNQTRLDLGQDKVADIATDRVVTTMKNADRHGRAHGKGFYDYPQEPEQRKALSPDLAELFELESNVSNVHDLKDRLLYIMALETARSVEEGVLKNARDANIGSIFGLGYPAWTGGTLQFINQVGLKQFVTRSQALAEQLGERFSPPQLLIDMAANEQTF